MYIHFVGTQLLIVGHLLLHPTAASISPTMPYDIVGGNSTNVPYLAVFWG